MRKSSVFSSSGITKFGYLCCVQLFLVSFVGINSIFECRFCDLVRFFSGGISCLFFFGKKRNDVLGFCWLGLGFDLIPFWCFHFEILRQICGQELCWCKAFDQGCCYSDSPFYMNRSFRDSFQILERLNLLLLYVFFYNCYF